MTDDHSANETDGTTVSIDGTAVGMDILGEIVLSAVNEGAIEAVGEPDSTGTLPERIRVRGSLDISPDDADR